MANRNKLITETQGRKRKIPLEPHYDFEPRISKQELEVLYGVTRYTINDWEKKLGLPLIRIGGKRYVRKSDLIQWENSLMADGKQNIWKKHPNDYK